MTWFRSMTLSRTSENYLLNHIDGGDLCDKYHITITDESFFLSRFSISYESNSEDLEEMLPIVMYVAGSNLPPHLTVLPVSNGLIFITTLHLCSC